MEVNKTVSSALSIRIPTEMKQWLADKASENHRSINAEIVVALKKIMQGHAGTAAQ